MNASGFAWLASLVFSLSPVVRPFLHSFCFITARPVSPTARKSFTSTHRGFVVVLVRVGVAYEAIITVPFTLYMC